MPPGTLIKTIPMCQADASILAELQARGVHVRVGDTLEATAASTEVTPSNTSMRAQDLASTTHSIAIEGSSLQDLIRKYAEDASTQTLDGLEMRFRCIQSADDVLVSSSRGAFSEEHLHALETAVSDHATNASPSVLEQSNVVLAQWRATHAANEALRGSEDEAARLSVAIEEHGATASPQVLAKARSTLVTMQEADVALAQLLPPVC